MRFNDKQILDDELIPKVSSFLKNYNNIYISKEQKNILDKYDININKYSSVSQLIFDIEKYLNESTEELNDLEWVSQTLSEYNYYNNTNK